MSSITSKNMYELLGNDPELDPERATPQPPTKAVDKPAGRIGKRNAGPEAPATAAPTSRPRGGHGGNHGFTGNEAAARDRTAGSYNNRQRAPDDGLRGDRHPDRLRGPDEHRSRGERGGRGRGGGRGPGGTYTRRDDRHSRTGVGEHEKQAGHGWGATTGEAEFADEKAGEAIAKEEEKEGLDTNVPPPVNADGEAWKPVEVREGEDETPAEPEDKSKSYAEYLSELAEKKLQLGGGSHEVRKPNEGASKKFPEGKAIAKEDEEDFIAGSGGKAKREREKKQKNIVDLDDAKLYQRDEPHRGGRGGRGGFRGDRDRGDRGGRGDRGEGGFRGEGRGRGGRGRGDRGDRPPRGDFRGGRGGNRGGAQVNIDSKEAFPSLGS